MAKKHKKAEELSGRVALVTGGSRGIGLSIAIALAKEGADVAICGRVKKDLDEALKSLKAINPNCRAFIADSAKPEQVNKVISEIKKHWKKLDILVNNIGGMGTFTNFEESTDSDWQDAFDLNIMSMVRFSRIAFPLLKDSSFGRVINMASVSGKRPGNFIPHYGAMKAAMIHLNKYLSNQWGKFGILVNAIAPHTVKGGAWHRDVADKAKKESLSISEATAKLSEEVARKTVINSVAELEDVTNMVVYLASDKARFITGQCLVIDGGAVNSIF